MPQHLHATHRIVVDAPVDRAFMFFTPAGEERVFDSRRVDLQPARAATLETRLASKIPGGSSCVSDHSPSS